VALLNTPSSERAAAFSPDGKWIAYLSEETGAREVYIRPFPLDASGKWLVSKGAASRPIWRLDGKELYYTAPDGSLMAVEIAANAAIQAGEPRALFKLRRGNSQFTVTPDGTRFLVSMRPTDSRAFTANPFTVVLNWTSALK
jgi:Tol biopolymer transport system component